LESRSAETGGRATRFAHAAIAEAHAMSDPNARALAEVARELERRHADRLRRLRAALLQGDTVEALRWARIVTGLEEGEPGAEGDRAPAREH
jgi:hypothetical protein